MPNQIDLHHSDRILITGGTGLVGKALMALLSRKGFHNVTVIGSRDCDLGDGDAVARLFSALLPDYVFHLAARVYGLGGNQKFKSDILYENVLINSHVVEQARISGVKKIVVMGSGCVYPELEGQEELFEEQIWIGPPHPSEDSYAHSKRMMLAHLTAAREQYGLASAFAISGNLYGPHDNFNIEMGHVTPTLVAKFFEAQRRKEAVTVWGSGVAIRDFSHCDDAAEALYEIMLKLEGSVNLGSGFRHPIADIVAALEKICDYTVLVNWDSSKPDGQLERFYNLDKLFSTGFTPKITLADGVKSTYEWYAKNWETARR